MELLEVLKEKNRNFSIAELAEAMDLPPSTVHRILQTFCEKKYVIRDDRSHTYRLGPALIPLGKAAARGIRLQDAAHGILAQLAKQTKEDAYLVIPVGNKGLVIEKVDGPSHLKVVEEFGYEMYMHCGAIRKVLLAWCRHLHRRILQKHYSPRSGFPHVRPDDLREELKRSARMATPSLTESMSPTPFGIGAIRFNSDGELMGSIESSPRRSGSILEFLTPRKISYSSTHHPPPISDMRSMMCSSKRNKSWDTHFRMRIPFFFALCSHARLVTSICPVPISPPVQLSVKPNLDLSPKKAGARLCIPAFFYPIRLFFTQELSVKGLLLFGFPPP